MLGVQLTKNPKIRVRINICDDLVFNIYQDIPSAAIPGILGNSMQEPMLRDRDDLRFVV
jgi:hypothetical protein